MLAAISQKSSQNKYGDKTDSLENNYLHYFEKLGIELLLIPNLPQKADYYFNHFPIEGLILSGGNDVDPESYGEKREENLSFALERDQTEKKMLEMAREKKLPVLGICRGLQFINVFFGGKLVEVNAEGSHPPAKNHLIKIIDDKLKPLFGEKKEVNSYHNWGLTALELSSQLKSFAVTEEGIIEGIFHPTLPIAGIQWHPERESHDEEFNKTLIKAFIERELFWKNRD